MPDVTLATVRPLLSQHRVDGSRLECTFTCPATGTACSTSVQLQEGAARGVAARASYNVKYGIFSAIRRAITNAIYKFTGGGMVGSVVSQTAGESADAAARPSGRAAVTHTQAEIDAGIVAAFVGVQNQFTWDGARWVARALIDGLHGAYETRAAAHPIVTEYDREITARLLAAVAVATGTVSAAAAARIAAIAPSRLGGVEGAQQAGVPSNVELGEASAGDVRQTVVQAAWGVAQLDGPASEAASQVVMTAAKGLGMDDAIVATLRTDAAHWAVNQAVAVAGADGTITGEERQSLVARAQALGLTADDAERAVVRFRKAKGL